MRMHRTTIDLDLEAVEKSAEFLGTRGYKETVNAALRHVAREAELAAAAEYWRSGRLSLPSEEELREMRRVRVPYR